MEARRVRQWYLVYTKVHKEQEAFDQLSNQGYEAFAPKIRVRKRRRGKYEWQMEAMFPRYIFIHLNDKGDNWAPIRSTRGVSNIVRFGIEPAVIADSVIEVLQSFERSQLPKDKKEAHFKAGQKIAILEGPFAGFEGVFEEAKGEDRAVVLLQYAEKFTKMQISLGDLGALS